MKKSRIHVTDHALIRYLERGLGLDTERLRREIGRRVDHAADHAGCSGVILDGLIYRIEGATVVTILRAARPMRGQGRHDE